MKTTFSLSEKVFFLYLVSVPSCFGSKNFQISNDYISIVGKPSYCLRKGNKIVPLVPICLVNERANSPNSKNGNEKFVELVHVIGFKLEYN